MTESDALELWRRIWPKVRLCPDTGCYLWHGALSRKRDTARPVIKVRQRVKSVARLVCEIQHGLPPTPEHEAGHTCPFGEHPRCINPDHLQWMTREENEQYKRRKAAKGDRACC